MDHAAHRGPESGAEQQDRGKGDQGRKAQPLDRECDEHGGEADHRTDRKIDAAGYDHERHPGRDNPKKGVVGEEIRDDAGRGNVGKLHRADRKTHNEHDRGDGNGRQVFHAFAPRNRAAKPATPLKPASRGDCSSSTAITTTAFTSRLNSGG